MKLSSFQKKQLADKIVGFYADKIGYEVGYFITPREREKLSVFAMKLLPLREGKFTDAYIKSLFSRTVKEKNVMMCLCASYIVHDVLHTNFLF